METNSSLKYPTIIQGGMGIAVSSAHLAREVAMHGQLGVVSGTAIDSVVASCDEQKISTLKPWQEGFGYNPTLTYSTNKLKS